MSANGISGLPTKELKQKAKLNIATLKRRGYTLDSEGMPVGDPNPEANFFRSRNQFDIDQLPTRYVGNDLVVNNTFDATVPGRPWLPSNVKPVYPIDSPVAQGVIPEIVRTINSGSVTIPGSEYFTGEQLTYSINPSVSGVSVNSSTGVITVTTTAEISQTSVTVVATNTSGFAENSFNLLITQVAPVTSGSIDNVSYFVGSGNQTINTSSYFTGVGLSYSLAASVSGISINSSTGVVTISTSTKLSNTNVTVIATNSGGTASQSFDVVVLITAPVASGTIPDVTYTVGDGVKTVNTAGYFAGSELVFSVSPPVTGVSINSGTGVMTITTNAALTITSVTVRATNSSGYDTRSFNLVVSPIDTVLIRETNGTVTIQSLGALSALILSRELNGSVTVGENI